MRNPMRPEQLGIHFNGHVLIKDSMTDAVILDRHNAIHPQNMALAAARALAGESTGHIYTLALGNGGTFYNSSQQLVYKTPNTIGSSAMLYNATYSIGVNSSISSAQSPSPAISSLIIITAQLNVNEPAGQAVSDNITTNPEASFVFDEIGLFTSDVKMVSHLVFAPIEKTANRAFLITYTITVNVN